jgi:pyruvate, water dikinase
MKKYLKKIFLGKSTAEPLDAEALRNDFKGRYHAFKLLLNANNKALALMGDLERALTGAFAFDMAFIQSRCTRISTNVFQIVKQINELSENKYAILFDRFKMIQDGLDPHVYPGTAPHKGPLVLGFTDIDAGMADQVGPKIATIGQVINAMELAAPDGFAVTTSGFHCFMAHNDLQTEINRRIQATDIRRENDRYALSMDLQQLIIRSDLPLELETAILEKYEQLAGGGDRDFTVALRSSALGEDLEGATFAGQFRSILNVSKEHLLAYYKEVVASKYSPTAMTYRLHHGILDEEIAMCVGVMKMVAAVAGGVVYSRSPLNMRDDRIFIHAAWGLPKLVVDGSADTDLFIIGRTDPPALLEKEVARKEMQYVCYPDEGVCRLELVAHRKSRACLTNQQAVELARLAMAIETHYGVAQDIEWALDDKGEIIILQSRPLRQLSPEQPVADSPIPTDPMGDGGAPGRVILRGGATASPGAAAGPVFILKKESDMLRFPDNAVLVTRQALPRWAMLLNRAAAVITETGSVAGHLANVAREFSVPALFSLPNAVGTLQNGRMVTVDAEGRAVYAGEIEAILTDTFPPRVLMEKSPVFKNLQQAAGLILPLNLIDPDSSEFRASNCRTMHDITRFCHENAVQEVFRFGKDHRFNERSGKQLRHKVPLKWWVLNLDDGFAKEVSGKYIDLNDIVSIPMLALWEGITAFPWEGPPAVDGKGLMSVMFRATTNRALVPTVKSSYANRNFFMISRYFCNLQSRLGFHFTTAEALVSERTPENYIVFHFKGGAADLNRRLKRVHFIKDILEGYEFSVRLNQDALSARIEAREMEEMKKYLRVLGYLSIHTRQLDMIMENPGVVDQYRAKIERELDQLLL